MSGSPASSIPFTRRQTLMSATRDHRWVKVLGEIAAIPLAWMKRSRDRKALAALDEDQLRDIGVTQMEVWLEISKPVWRR